MPNGNGPRVVTVVGGGHGATMIVREIVQGLENGRYVGLDPYSVTTGADSGGFSGELRKKRGTFAVGDFKRTVEAHSTGKTDPRILELLTTRFDPNDKHYPNMSFGHLYFSYWEEHLGRRAAMRKLTSMLDMCGMSYPVSLDDYHLYAELNDGTVIEGEANIDTRDPDDPRIIRKVWLDPIPVPYARAIETIAASDLVILAFGDVITSLGQIILVPAVAEALMQAKSVVYCLPLMTKAAETPGFDAADYLEQLSIFGLERKLDAVFVNVGQLPWKTRMRYAAEDAKQVAYNPKVKRRMLRYTLHVVKGKFFDRSRASSLKAYHDTEVLMKSIFETMMSEALAVPPTTPAPDRV